MEEYVLKALKTKEWYNLSENELSKGSKHIQPQEMALRNSFSIEQLKKSACAGKNQHLFEEKKVRKPRKISKHVTCMEEVLKEWCSGKGYELLTEHKFSEYRKFKFDFAIKELMIAIEYEGLQSEISGHTTLMGYTKDTDKYNLAQSEGWKVLRFTVLNFKEVINILDKY